MTLRISRTTKQQVINHGDKRAQNIKTMKQQSHWAANNHEGKRITKQQVITVAKDHEVAITKSSRTNESANSHETTKSRIGTSETVKPRNRK